MSTKDDTQQQPSTPPPVYIVSGGVGASGEQLLHTALAQFPDNHMPVFTVCNVRRAEQIEKVVTEAKSSGGTILHTLVEANLRQILIDRAGEERVTAIDLMGPALERLGQVLGRAPLEQPGLYRQLNKTYFDRVGAIEYSMAHDDGKNSEGWSQAEILLVGVSRTGKTPLSLYLSVLGWKVANLPLVAGVQPPSELYQVDPKRVIGLTIDPGQLILHRQQRQQQLGVVGTSQYADPAAVYEEVQTARKFFRKNGFTVVDVTDKPIETTADDVLKLIARISST